MTPEKTSVISIERVVAFVVGPLLTVGFGWLGSWLIQNVPGAPPIPAEAATYVGGAISLGVAGLIYKWLHGRQTFTGVKQIIEHVQAVPGAEGFLMTTAKDLEGLVESTVRKVTNQPMASGSVGSGLGSVTVGQDKPPPEVVIPPAPNDPAPAGQVADAGAAPAS